MDNLGAEVGQHHGRRSSGQNVGQINDAYAFQSSRHFPFSFNLWSGNLLAASETRVPEVYLRGVGMAQGFHFGHGA